MFFVLILPFMLAQEGAYDCDDTNPDIFPGQVETCYDKVDNNCNMDESAQLDLDPATGVDEKDIDCCDITGVSWLDADAEVYPDKTKLPEGTAVKIRVNGTRGCQEQTIDIEILEDDGILGYDYLFDNITGSFGVADAQGRSFATLVWILNWTKDVFDITEFNNDPEYVAKAYAIDSIATEYDFSQTIQVYQAAAGCEIDKVNWSTPYNNNYMKDGDEVQLIVDTLGLDCAGLTVNFELYEDDGWFGDDVMGDVGIEYQIDSATIEAASTTSQTWVATYHLQNDDNDEVKGIYKDLEYYFKAIIGGKEETSDNAIIRICDTNDQDCDGICDPGQIGTYCNLGKDGEGDKCPDTPFGTIVDDTGCSETQRNCLVYWDCSAVEWIDKCDNEPPIFTRDIGDCSDIIGNPSACKCSYSGQGTECEGLGITPATTKGCVISETFPVFTGFNIFMVVILLSFYYIFRKK